MIPEYVREIKLSLKNQCYFTALALALTLPDICGGVEFPGKSVTERYIRWYDNYIGKFANGSDLETAGQVPMLSGEVVYNLRNTFLHNGLPNVDSSKIKEPTNRLDRFILVLGDGTVIWDMTSNVEIGPLPDSGEIITVKVIMVDISYLCDNISDSALWYFEKNRERFSFDFQIISQEELLNPANQGEPFAEILNEKMEKQGRNEKITGSPKRRECHVKAEEINRPIDNLKAEFD